MGTIVEDSMQGVTSNWSVHINTQINPNAICIVRTLLVMILALVDIILDVEGAFFQGRFTNGDQMPTDVLPDGMDKFYRRM